MICKIIEDDYTFEQIESIEAILELEKKYSLNISIEDKTYPEFYPEIGLQTSYKVYKNDKLIAFSGFLFYFYDIADLTSFDIAKICRFKIKHFPKQYEINLDLLKFGEIGTIWYLIENKWWSYFTSESKKDFLHEETFEEIFLSQDFNKENYKDLIKLLKYSKKVRAPIAECMYKYIQLHNYPISSYSKCEKLLSKYADYFNELFTLFVTKDACLSLSNKEETYKIIDTLRTLGLNGYWQQKNEDKYETYYLYEKELKISKENFLTLCSLTEKCTLTIEIKYKVIIVNSFKHSMLIKNEFD